jgi:hypothetical protein
MAFGPVRRYAVVTYQQGLADTDNSQGDGKSPEEARRPGICGSPMNAAPHLPSLLYAEFEAG